MLRKTICIHPSSDLISESLKDALAHLVPVRFIGGEGIEQWQGADAVISLSDNEVTLGQIVRQKIPCFHVATAGAQSSAANEDTNIRFGNSQDLDQRVRGRTIRHKPVPECAAVLVEDGDEVLARCGEVPVWVRRRIGEASAEIVSIPLPILARNQRAFDYLDGYQFIRLLPLLHFLRQVAADLGWTLPPLRACLMFDDPNLHWSSYGCVPFERLVEQAKDSNFHVCFATVPLDVWGSHRRTVNLFRENPAQLSLLIHGNNHVRQEFGRERTSEEYLRLMAQSLKRIAHLEQTTGLQVSRVMVPPHEAVVVDAVTSMLAVGFEGACLTLWSLRIWNPDHQWPSAFGLEIAEIVNGFPVLPRFDLSGSCEGPIIISAFLGRPIVVFEHHEALAGGLGILSDVARIINSLGMVHWCNPEEMLRSNYLSLQHDDILLVKPFSTRIRLSIPFGVKSLVVMPLNISEAANSYEFIISTLPQNSAAGVRISLGVPVPVTPGSRMELVSVGLGTVDYRQVQALRLSISALSRRVLCEGRDRLLAASTRLRRA